MPDTGFNEDEDDLIHSRTAIKRLNERLWYDKVYVCRTFVYGDPFLVIGPEIINTTRWERQILPRL